MNRRNVRAAGTPVPLLGGRRYARPSRSREARDYRGCSRAPAARRRGLSILARVGESKPIRPPLRQRGSGSPVDRLVGARDRRTIHPRRLLIRVSFRGLAQGGGSWLSFAASRHGRAIATDRVGHVWGDNLNQWAQAWRFLARRTSLTGAVNASGGQALRHSRASISWDVSNHGRQPLRIWDVEFDPWCP